MNSPVWFPYAQMKTLKPYKVVGAGGVTLHLEDGREVIDAISSWWCAIHGYGHPEIIKAAKDQLDLMPHVMLGGITHPQVEKLAHRLVQITPTGLNHVFFGDSGSVGVEIGLKMALQFRQNQGSKQKTKILALKNAYHGDTFGAMSVCDPGSMHALFAGILPRQLFLDAPRGGFEADEKTVLEDAAKLEAMLQAHAHEIAAMIVEPLMQGAGGFNFYSPRFLQKARELCDEYDVLLIFDEVATGFGRTGALFAADLARVCPDIMVLSKALTAGTMGHSATLATSRVFDGFYSDDPSKIFMHGPTFTGNPLACAIANRSIEIFMHENYLVKISGIQKLLKQKLPAITSDKIKDVRVLGACGVIEVHDPKSLVGMQEFAVDHGVWLRPIGPYVYTMPAYVISDEQLSKIVEVMGMWFDR